MGHDLCPDCGVSIDLMVTEECARCGWVNPNLSYEPEWTPGAGSTGGKILLVLLLIGATTGLTYFFTTGGGKDGGDEEVAAAAIEEPTETKKPKKEKKEKKGVPKEYSNHPCTKLERECRGYARKLQEARISPNPDMNKTIKYQILIEQCHNANGAVAEFMGAMGYSKDVNQQMLQYSKEVCSMYRESLKSIERSF